MPAQSRPVDGGTFKVKVELKKVSRDYEAGSITVHALKDIELTVKGGEFVALMGPSGSGKTTLLNMMGALDRPTKGRVLLDGKDIGTMHEWKRSELRLRKIGFIFQEFNLVPSMTALENVKLPLSGARPFGPGNRTRALELLGRVGLSNMARRYPSQLSGGEQQRVAIARCLANDPPLILADEPTGELDSESSAMVMDLLRDQNQREGRTLVVVTHDPEVSRKARRVVKIRNGRISS